MATYKVYAEDMIDKTRRYLGEAVGDNIGKGLFDLYADECGDREEIVLVPTDTASEMGRKGGQAKSERKTSTARENGRKSRGPWKNWIAGDEPENCIPIGESTEAGAGRLVRARSAAEACRRGIEAYNKALK